MFALTKGILLAPPLHPHSSGRVFRTCTRTRVGSRPGSDSGPRNPRRPRSPLSLPTDRFWYPGAKAPEWLDGSLVGDYGFDPFGLGKPAEYLQYDYDGLDQNLAKNLAGDIIGTRTETADVQSTPFQPYNEVFGLQRFRECELIHGRWAMLATLGALTVESLTGITWQDAGKVELIEGSSYLGQPLPFSITTLIWIEVLVIGYIEFQRNAELDPEKRLYPGWQAAVTGKGPLNNWATHLSDPLHTTIIDSFTSS
ncbi:chlorophyll a-b binding protein CP29.1 chloroplastic [Prunus yedoensis var. nudiflora]|uniref:Chlorophyll a-b binding protein, chloroplastic n=1 Tax=Prunus yedoensis var. nudiflora TaxID=2094558 RepID=A0A314YMX3_PRUYE|nr:chlorophyll a-b binding protein CP29.1 chloroplastic [Prunus yedoensis var. nudiflora]